MWVMQNTDNESEFIDMRRIISKYLNELHEAGVPAWRLKATLCAEVSRRTLDVVKITRCEPLR